MKAKIVAVTKKNNDYVIDIVVGEGLHLWFSLPYDHVLVPEYIKWMTDGRTIEIDYTPEQLISTVSSSVGHTSAMPR